MPPRLRRHRARHIGCLAAFSPFLLPTCSMHDALLVHPGPRMAWTWGRPSTGNGHARLAIAHAEPCTRKLATRRSNTAPIRQAALASNPLDARCKIRSIFFNMIRYERRRICRGPFEGTLLSSTLRVAMLPAPFRPQTLIERVHALARASPEEAQALLEVWTRESEPNATGNSTAAVWHGPRRRWASVTTRMWERHVLGYRTS